MASAPATPDIRQRIEQIARELGIDPTLMPELFQFIMKTVAQESAFSPLAVSPAGARGLFQLTPIAQRDVPRAAKAAGLPAMGPVTDPHDIDQNARGGIALLLDLVDRYGGNLPFVAAASNFGPANFDAYLAGQMPLPAETIKHVKKTTGMTLPQLMAPGRGGLSFPVPQDLSGGSITSARRSTGRAVPADTTDLPPLGIFAQATSQQSPAGRMVTYGELTDALRRQTPADVPAVIGLTAVPGMEGLVRTPVGQLLVEAFDPIGQAPPLPPIGEVHGPPAAPVPGGTEPVPGVAPAKRKGPGFFARLAGAQVPQPDIPFTTPFPQNAFFRLPEAVANFINTAGAVGGAREAFGQRRRTEAREQFQSGQLLSGMIAGLPEADRATLAAAGVTPAAFAAAVDTDPAAALGMMGQVEPILYRQKVAFLESFTPVLKGLGIEYDVTKLAPLPNAQDVLFEAVRLGILSRQVRQAGVGNELGILNLFAEVQQAEQKVQQEVDSISEMQRILTEGGDALPAEDRIMIKARLATATQSAGFLATAGESYKALRQGLITLLQQTQPDLAETLAAAPPPPSSADVDAALNKALGLTVPGTSGAPAATPPAGGGVLDLLQRNPIGAANEALAGLTGSTALLDTTVAASQAFADFVSRSLSFEGLKLELRTARFRDDPAIQRLFQEGTVAGLQGDALVDWVARKLWVLKTNRSPNAIPGNVPPRPAAQPQR